MVGYKVNLEKSKKRKEKSNAFPVTSNEQVEFEVKSTIPLILVPPQNELLRHTSNKTRTRCT